MRKVIFLIATTISNVGPASYAAPVYELEENTWDNPRFVARFVGSYGFDSGSTPSINAEEKTLFEELATIIPNDPKEAVRRLNESITAESSGALDYTLGNLHFQAGENDEAIAAYTTALEKFPAFSRARKNLGILYVQQGEYDAALDSLLAAVESGGIDGSLLGMIGFCYLNTGKTASALDSYRLALVLEPGSRDWQLGKAQCLINIGEHKEAIAMLEEMIQKDDPSSDLLLLQANAFVADGAPMQAAANIQIVHALGKATANSLVLLGDIFVNDGNPESAMPWYLEAIDMGGLEPDRMIRMVRILCNRDAWMEAESMIARIREQESGKLTDAQTLELLNFEAQSALGQNKDDDAAKILESVVARDPLNGRALLLLADYHWKQGSIERAELNYSRAAEVPAVAPEALVQQARMHVSLKNFSQAAQLLSRAQSLRPQAHVAEYLSKVESAARAVQ